MRAVRKPVPNLEARPRRAALYLRVSTGRQAENDVSLPSQRNLTRAHCEREGWSVVDEYVEPGVSATDDRRPAFREMIERACEADRPYDVIVVHAFSRFFRDGASMELTIRKLRRHGVEVVSTTQPTGADPSQEMMRQIIGLFDEYTSKENAKQVTRAMRENARAGILERCLRFARLSDRGGRAAGPEDQEEAGSRPGRGGNRAIDLQALRRG